MASRPLTLAATAAARAGLGRLRHVPVTGSTNDDLTAEARAGLTSPAILVTDHQTGGRGRHQRTWTDEAGSSLLFSIREPVGSADPHLIPACLAVAARAAADGSCPVDVRSKWPNDLVVEDGAAPGKLGGILAELVTGAPDVVVVGLGLNLTPVAAQPGATSIGECGGDPDPDELLTDIVDGYAAARSDPDRVLSDLRRSSATLGRDVRVDLGSTTIEGRAVDLTRDGRLVVETNGRRQVIDAGDVVHLHPLEPPVD